jgi:hypothetical protein
MQKHKLQSFKFWSRLLRDNSTQQLTFPEKVTDLKVKRRLLEINRHELLTGLAVDE